MTVTPKMTAKEIEEFLEAIDNIPSKEVDDAINTIILHCGKRGMKVNVINTKGEIINVKR